MNLYILRHAIAIERGTPGYENDSKRPLTPQGRKKMQRNALGMKAFGLSFDIILCSPYIRTQQTAAIVIDVFRINKERMTLTENLIPEASFESLMSQINAYDGKKKNILLVGHEPALGGLIAFFLTGKKNLSLPLKKGGLCHLKIKNILSPGYATLEWLLTPAQLRLIHVK